MPLAGGEVFAGYRIQRALGSGAMGEVYLAQHPRLPRLYALKVLLRELSGDADYRLRFNREADIAATLYHQHIVGVHDRGEDDGRLWISMDFVDGTDAGRFLRDRYPAGVPAREAIQIITAVASALDYAHQHRCLHRDVKPANILLSNPGANTSRIVLSDFGIARRTQDDVIGLTATNMIVATVFYAAPEQLMGHPLDGRVDQYALAVTAYELLTGTRPIDDQNQMAVISRRLTEPPPSVAKLRPELAALDPVLTIALSKDPNDRFATCADFASALATAGGGIIQTSAQTLQSTATRDRHAPDGLNALSPKPHPTRPTTAAKYPLPAAAAPSRAVGASPSRLKGMASQGHWRPIVIALVVAAIAIGVVVVAWHLSNPVTTEAARPQNGVSVASSPTPTTPIAPATMAPFKINGGSRPDNGLTAAQKWANDVAAGRMGALTAKCWTFAPERVQMMYGDPAWLAKILITPGQPVQVGMAWGTPPSTIDITADELNSDYPCPVVSIPGVIDSSLHDFDARHLVLRALSRQIGHPIAPSDTQTNYPLQCDFGPNPITDLSAALGPMQAFDPDSIQVTMLPGSDPFPAARITALVDGRTVTLNAASVLSHACIVSVA